MTMDQGKATGSAATEKVTDQKMDAALKAKWVEALRSGNYEQNRGALGFNNRLCCLGVLWAVEGRPASLNSLWDRTVGGRKGDLIRLNDDEGKSFPEIADFIEAHF